MIFKKSISPIFSLMVFCNLSTHPVGAQCWNAVSRENNMAIIDNRRPEVWTLRPFKRKRIIELWRRSTTTPALSRDGKLVAYGLEDSRIEIFETKTGKLWKRLGRPQQNQDDKDRYEVNTVAFAPNGRLLASGNRKGIFFWRVRNGKLLFSNLAPKNPEYNGQGVDYIEFAPNSRSIAVSGGYMSTIYLFDLKRKSFGVQYRTNSEDGKALNMKFSPNGRRLLVSSYWNVSGSSHDQIHLFDVHSGRIKWKWNNRRADQYDNSSQLIFATWSRDGKRVSIGDEQQLQIRDSRTGKLLLKRQFNWSDNSNNGPDLQQQRRFHPQLNIR